LAVPLRTGYEEASYIIYEKDKGSYYAKDGRTGDIAFGGPNNVGGVSGSDAAAVIQAAINALTIGGKILLKEGTFLIGAEITLPSNVIIEGSGPETILKLKDNANLADYSSIIRNSDFISGNSHIGVTNIKLDGNQPNNPEGINHRYQAIKFKNVEHASLSKLWVVDVNNWAIRIDTCKDVKIYDVRIVQPTAGDPGDDGVHFIDSQNCQLSKAYIEAPFDDSIAITAENADCTGIVISDCVVKTYHGPGATTGHGIRVALEAGATGTCREIVISNVIVLNAYHGILLQGNATYRIRNVEVSNVLCLGCTINGVYATYADIVGVSTLSVYDPGNYGLRFENSTRVIVEGVHVEDAYDDGIWLQSSECQVSGCSCFNCGDNGLLIAGDHNLVENFEGKNNNTADSATNGIYLINCLYCMIIGSHCYDDRTPKHQEYGIYEGGGCDYNIILANDCRGNKTGVINRLGPNTIVRDNPGYVTENRGIAVMAAGGLITVTHQMNEIPVVITVTAQEDLGDVWVPAGKIDVVGFTIQCDAPVAGVSVFWEAYARSTGMYW